MSKSKVRMNVRMKGVMYEACASEGHCSFYFGRDREEPCKSFQFTQLEEGYIGDVDFSGLCTIDVIDLYSNKATDLFTVGGEGGAYISENTTEEQRKYIEAYYYSFPPGNVLKKILGIRYVDINFSQEGKIYHVKMPYGEMKLSLTTGMDGKNPQRIENSPFGAFLKEVNICNTHFWKYNDFGRNWYFKNRSGMIGSFDLESKVKLAI